MCVHVCCACACAADCAALLGWNDDLWGQGYLKKAVDLGLTDEATITASTKRTLMQKMKVRSRTADTRHRNG